MSEEEALEALKYHSGEHSDFESIRWQNGFLGSLRSYRGELNFNAMRELELILRVLAPMLQRGDSVGRKILGDFLAIIGCGQYWALLPVGMLQRNGLIEDKDIAVLTAWLAGFSIAFSMIIEGSDIDSALGMIEPI